jgi:EAL domain-containing protein (putative c-di-GMP-specific phosphodiesterase class I)
MNGGSSLHDAIRDAGDPMIVMDRIVHEALAVIPSANGALVELADVDSLSCVCGAGILTGAVGMQLHFDDSLSGLAFETGATLRCDDSEQDPRVHRAAFRRTGSRSAICVPLRRGNHPVGVFSVTSSSPAAFDQGDVERLTGLAEFITATITTAWEMNKVTGQLLASFGSIAPAPSGDGDNGVSRFVANVLHPGVSDGVAEMGRIRQVLNAREFTMVFQPVVDLRSNEIVGAEALARFQPGPYRPPDVWFAEAHRVGLGIELEHAAVRTALNYADRIPPNRYIAVNVGPEALESRELAAALDSVDGHRVVIELTEQTPVADYSQLRRALLALRRRGVRLAVDDTGSGVASLSHIVKLAPDIVKIDKELIQGIDFDPVRRSLVSAVVAFAPELGAEVVAEGIETAAEYDTLRSLEVAHGQGYFLGRPGPVEMLFGYQEFASFDQD